VAVTKKQIQEKVSQLNQLGAKLAVKWDGKVFPAQESIYRDGEQTTPPLQAKEIMLWLCAYATGRLDGLAGALKTVKDSQEDIAKAAELNAPSKLNDILQQQESTNAPNQVAEVQNPPQSGPVLGQEIRQEGQGAGVEPV